MTQRGLTAAIPVWVRVPAIIVLVLVGVIVSAMLVGATGAAGRGGMGGMGGMEQNVQNHGPARH